MPERARFWAEKDAYYFEVVPRPIRSVEAYRLDLEAGTPHAGAIDGREPGFARGTLYKKIGKEGFERVWSIRLLNDVAPVSALVSRSGAYVVTFDNWHRVGFGHDVVVIYGPGPTLVRRFALEDLAAPKDIARFPASDSSRWWGAGHFIDEKRGQLVLRLVSSGGTPEQRARYDKQIRIDLATGAIAKK
jgi:hypothetical protein